MNADAVARFAGYVATLGRGPGRSRALTRPEAADAMGMLLAGAADPMQVGAFMMLLRYRGEDAAEIAGLVEGVRARSVLPGVEAALDWPSYGAGRTRGAPWFLLAALALGQAGVPVLMHGTNEFSGGMTVAQGLAALGLAPAETHGAVARDLAARGFAYLPVAALNQVFADLLGLRRLFGLRSPMNTVARLLNPARAAAAVDGVFHPPYIETHLAAAELLGGQRLLVLKGGGGEAERNPAKPVEAFLWDPAHGRSAQHLPAISEAGGSTAGEPALADIWHGAARDAAIEARVVGTISLGLLALGVARDGQDADTQAQILWENRRPIC